MGNIAYMSRKNGAGIASVDFEITVTCVNHDCFGGVFDLRFYPEGVEVSLDGKNCWDWWRASSRKYGGKHPRGGEGMTWAYLLFKCEVAQRLGCRLSDDGCRGEFWLPEPDKYRTFDMYLQDRYEELPGYADKRRVEILRDTARIGFPDKLKTFAGMSEWSASQEEVNVTV